MEYLILDVLNPSFTELISRCKDCTKDNQAYRIFSGVRAEESLEKGKLVQAQSFIDFLKSMLFSFFFFIPNR